MLRLSLLRRPRALLLCLSVLVSGAGVIPTAQAAGGWGGYEVVETGDLVSGGTVIDRRGRATVLLERTGSSTGAPSELYAVRRRPDGAWSSPRFLARMVRGSAAVSASDNGVVTVGYLAEDDEGLSTVHARVFRPGAGWSPRRRLSAHGVRSSGTVIRSNASGRTIIGWSSSSPDWRLGSVSTVTHVNGEWERRRVHTRSYNRPGVEAVAVDRAGHQAVAWRDTEGLHVRRRGVAGGRGWQAAQYLAYQGTSLDLQLVDGDLTLVWLITADTDAAGDTAYRTVTRRQRWSGAWTRRTRLSPSGDSPRSFRLAVDDEGRALVLWFAGTEGSPVHARARRLNGSWGPVHEVVPAHGARNVLPQLEVDGHGVWHLLAENALGDAGLQYRRRVPGRRWSEARSLHDEAHKLSGGRYFLAVARNGQVAATWEAFHQRTLVRVRQPS